METETIDRLFLELSQFTTAKTKRELELETKLIQWDKTKTHLEWAAHEVYRLAAILRANTPNIPPSLDGVLHDIQRHTGDIEKTIYGMAQ